MTAVMLKYILYQEQFLNRGLIILRINILCKLLHTLTAHNSLLSEILLALAVKTYLVRNKDKA